MNGKFIAPVNTMQLQDVLENHEPFAAVVVSTTGMDNAECMEHSPIRVVLKQFEYDESIEAYQEAFAFDKMVAAPQAAIDVAIATADAGGYDVFRNGDINRETYLRGDGVLSVEQFQHEFKRAMDAVQESGAILIANDTQHCEKYLAKIGCSAEIGEMSKELRVLDQTRITKEYFGLKGIEGSATLKDLRNHITPMSRTVASVMNNETLAKDFGAMTQEEFKKAHPEVTTRQYQMTRAYSERCQSDIIGGNARIAVIADFVKKFGQERDLLVSDMHSRMLQGDKAYTERLSDDGKQKYQAQSTTEKFATLTEIGAIKPDEIRKGNSTFHQLMDAVEDKSNKGLIIFHVATTGFEFDKKAPAVTGQPIQFSAAVYPRKEDGTLDMAGTPTGKNFLITASSKSVILAEKNITAARRPYDAFKEAGINLEAYKQKNGEHALLSGKPIKILSQEEAATEIKKFFEQFQPEDYTVVVMGGKGKSYPDRTYAQTALQNLGRFPICDAEVIDFTQAIKDYCYWQADTAKKLDGNNLPNVLFGSAKPEKFGIANIAEAQNIPVEKIASCSAKCTFVARCIGQMELQQEVLRGDAQKAVQQTAEKTETPKTAPVHESHSDSKPADFGHIGRKPEQTVSASSDTLPKTAEDIDQEMMDMPLEFMTGMQDDLSLSSGTVKTTSHGRLYSDKKNDSVPIVHADNVRQVGTAPIPHISEASAEKDKSDTETRRPRPDSRRREPTAKPVASPIRSPRTPEPVQNDSITQMMELAKLQAETARQQAETASSLVNAQKEANARVDKMLAQLEKQQAQNELLTQENAVLTALVSRVTEALQQQNEVLMQLAQETQGKEATVSKNNLIDFLEYQKEQIDEIRTSLPEGAAKTQLTNANKAITDAQSALEDKTKNKEKAS